MKVELLEGGALLLDGAEGGQVTDVIALLDYENQLLRARNERLENENYQLRAQLAASTLIWRNDDEPND